MEEVGADDTASAASPKTLEPLPRTRRSCQAPLQESAGNPDFWRDPWTGTRQRAECRPAGRPRPEQAAMMKVQRRGFRILRRQDGGWMGKGLGEESAFSDIDDWEASLLQRPKQSKGLSISPSVQFV